MKLLLSLLLVVTCFAQKKDEFIPPRLAARIQSTLETLKTPEQITAYMKRQAGYELPKINFGPKRYGVDQISNAFRVAMRQRLARMTDNEIEQIIQIMSRGQERTKLPGNRYISTAQLKSGLFDARKNGNDIAEYFIGKRLADLWTFFAKAAPTHFNPAGPTMRNAVLLVYSACSEDIYLDSEESEKANIKLLGGKEGAKLYGANGIAFAAPLNVTLDKQFWKTFEGRLQ